jgi:hypothetical protein
MHRAPVRTRPSLARTFEDFGNARRWQSSARCVGKAICPPQFVQTSGGSCREHATACTIVIGRESRRPSIPETRMIETKSRSVLDTPAFAGYDRNRIKRSATANSPLANLYWTRAVRPGTAFALRFANDCPSNRSAAADPGRMSHFAVQQNSQNSPC